MSAAISYEEIVNFAGGSSCVNEGQFILKIASLFVAELMGTLTISTEAKNKLKERFS